LSASQLQIDVEAGVLIEAVCYVVEDFLLALGGFIVGCYDAPQGAEVVKGVLPVVRRNPTCNKRGDLKKDFRWMV
jgi:hypothetical protein